MKKLTEGNIYKTFILFAVPLVLSGMLSQAYSLIDTVIAGRFLGEEGLAAIGATSSLRSALCSVFWGFGMGFGVYIARLFGAGEYTRIKRGIYTHLTVCTAATLAVAVLTILFHDFIFDLLKIEPALRDGAFRYFSIYIAGLFLFILNNNGVYLMNALGISSFPFYMSVISAVLNVAGNILSVTVLNLGVAGIAAASVVAAATVSVCYLWRFRRCFREMEADRQKIPLSFLEMRQALPYTIPTILQQVSMYLANLLLSPILNGIGNAAIASYVIALQLYNVNASMYQNASRTVSNYGAQCMGGAFSPEEKRARLKKGLFVGYLQGNVFLLLFLLPCILFPTAVVALFFPDGSSAEGLDIAIRFVRVFLPFILFNLVNNLFHSFFRGVMAMKILMCTTIFGAVVRVAVSWALTVAFGVDGFYAGWAISWIAEALLCLVVYCSGAWLPKELKKNKTYSKISNIDS